MMTVPRFRQAPLRVPGNRKRQMRTQFGALCWRLHEGRLQILLITSRGRGRWIIPKGWPVDGETPCAAAASEAWEEAGAEGIAGSECLGLFSYTKTGARRRGDLPCVVAVFPIEVERLCHSYPECGQRKRRWVSAAKAALLVEEEELAQIILHFAPPAAERRIAYA